MNNTIIIIGAGAAGLLAAKELSAQGRPVILLEARDRLGGRMHTCRESKFQQPVEYGAEFVHGNLPVTLGLLKEAGIKYVMTERNVSWHENGKWTEGYPDETDWNKMMHQLDKLKEDMTLYDFLQAYFKEDKYAQLRNEVQRFASGYDLADINTASAKGLISEWMQEDEQEYHIPNGYGQLVDYLHKICVQNKVEVHTSAIVKKVEWQQGHLKVTTATGEVYEGVKLVVTVPLGVLKADQHAVAAIEFIPALAKQMAAINEIGFGPVMKVHLQFSRRFWEDAKKELGLFVTQEKMATWWTQFPTINTLLTGWVGGSLTAPFEQLSDEEIIESAITSLSKLFDLPVNEIKVMLLSWSVTNWAKDPFALGGYSYPQTGTKAARQLLSEPVEHCIYFAGEAMYGGSPSGTVEAALCSALAVVSLLNE